MWVKELSEWNQEAEADSSTSLSVGDKVQDPQGMPETVEVANPIHTIFFLYMHTSDKVYLKS